MRHKFTSAIILLTLIFGACESEPAISLQDNTIGEVTAFKARQGIVNPENSSNPYDIAGQLHNDLLEAYLPNEDNMLSGLDIFTEVETLALADSRFITLAGGTYTTPNYLVLNAIHADPVSTTPAVIAAANLGTAAKLTLSQFLDHVIYLYTSNTVFGDSYDEIIAFESQVLTGSYTLKEKEILLTTASIARYSLYFSSRHERRKPRDRDWDTLITTFTAAIDGSAQGIATAVTQSVASAALGNL